MLSSGNTNYMLSSNTSKQIKYTIINDICVYLPIIHFFWEHVVFTELFFLPFSGSYHHHILTIPYTVFRSTVQSAFQLFSNSFTWIVYFARTQDFTYFCMRSHDCLTVFTMWKCMLYFVYPSCVWIKRLSKIW